MNNNNKVLDIFFVIFVFFMSIFSIYLVFGNIISNITVTGETLFMPFTTYLSNTENVDYFGKMFLSSDHSWFLASFVLHLFSRVLPSVSNIHPQEFYLSYAWIAFFLIFCIFCYTITLNFSKYFKFPFAPLLSFWVTFPFIVINFLSSHFVWVLYNDTWFVCYIFNSLFPLFLFQIIEKYYVTKRWFFASDDKEKIITNKFIHYAKISGIILLVFLTGIGHELYRFVLLGTLILGFIFHKLFIKTDINYKSYILFLFVAIIMNCFLFLIPTFHEWFNYNVDKFSFISSFFKTNKAFLDYVICGNIWKLIFIPIFLGYAYFAVDDKEQAKRLTVVVGSAYISLLIFNYIIIFLTDCDLSISHHYGIRFLIKTVLLTLLFSVVGFVFAKSSEKYKKISIISSVIFFVIWAMFPFCKYFYELSGYEMDSEYILENQYIVEKFYNLYGKNNNVIYATYPEQTICEHSYHYFKNWYGGSDKPYKLIFVCKQGDSYEVCQQKLIKKMYEKTHLRVYEDELSDFEFSEMPSYKKRKLQGKFRLKFF